MRTPRSKRLFHVAAIALLLSCAVSAAAAGTVAESAVRNVLELQREAWNRGDLEGFMQGYWKNDAIRFAGGDSFRTGWQATLDSYRKGYPDAAAMGQLTFDPIEVRELSPDVVYVFGKWKLTRINDAADKAPHGLFTLLFERKNGAWLVTRDHSSAAGG